MREDSHGSPLSSRQPVFCARGILPVFDLGFLSG
jgi:hypothetical protein